MWILFGVAGAFLLSTPGFMTWLYAAVYSAPIFVLLGLICLSAWYLCKFFPFRKNHIVKIFVVFGIAAFINSSIWLLIATEWALLFDSILPFANGIGSTIIETNLFFVLGFILYLFSGAGHYLFIVYDEAQNTQRRLIETNALARDAELKALRSQINPHFLFNSLNSISALTTSDPKAARRMTELLAEFFRKSLDAGKKEFVTLKEELELTSNYLDIERIRFGRRLAVDIQVDEECLSKSVPPLILQPLVENSVKHGIAHLIDGGTITVKAECGKRSLTVTIENPCDPNRPKGRGNRLGLENIRSRLNAIYDSKSDVVAKEENNIFKVVLLIKE
jgi:two-component system, LytTR family, sensor histidine kinase AlgZ